jgi:hypothetical protein
MGISLEVVEHNTSENTPLLGCGAEVTLNSGGPRMKITDVMPGGIAKVVWDDREDSFPLACLTPI